jgi:WD40 repeat protein
MSGSEVTVLVHNSPVISLAFSPSGELVASGTRDGVLHIWDMSTYRQISELNANCGILNDLAFSPNGVFVAAGCSDRTVRLYGIPN